MTAVHATIPSRNSQRNISNQISYGHRLQPCPENFSVCINSGNLAAPWGPPCPEALSQGGIFKYVRVYSTLTYLRDKKVGGRGYPLFPQTFSNNLIFFKSTSYCESSCHWVTRCSDSVYCRLTSDIPASAPPVNKYYIHQLPLPEKVHPGDTVHWQMANLVCIRFWTWSHNQ